MKRIKSLPPSLRPREKLLKYGVQALTLEELISVILVTGTKTFSVSKISTQIGQKLSKKNLLSKEILLNMKLGPSKTAQLLAVIEVAQRLLPIKQTLAITKIEEVVALSFEIAQAQKEMLICFYLNARSELLKKEVVVIGSLNKANLLPREIFSLIRELPIAGIILVHNHPSGNLDPSNEDLVFTKRVKESGEILGVKLLDHIIVSTKGWKKVPF